jgi:hypothetical protein
VKRLLQECKGQTEKASLPSRLASSESETGYIGVLSQTSSERPKTYLRRNFRKSPICKKK